MRTCSYSVRSICDRREVPRNYRVFRGGYQRDLTPKTFQTSILCQRIGITHDGFYSSMQEHHKYDASNFAYLDELGYDKILKETSIQNYDIRANSQFSTLNSPLDSRADEDINPLTPICIGMDYNANINWIVCGQPSGNRLNVLKSFYVKFERKIPALVEDFCAYYAYHQNKTVVCYYDTTALGSNYAVNDQDFRYVVVHEFERHGWQVVDVYLGNPMHHDEKYLLINQGFAGKQRLMPFFNRQNNDDLILAIQSAGVERGRNGFRKKGGTPILPSVSGRVPVNGKAARIRRGLAGAPHRRHRCFRHALHRL